MPHLTVEYSANVAEVVAVDELVNALHDAALATGVAPLDALRTRAARRDHYAIADRDPANAFVAVVARFGAGRSDDDKRAVVEALMAALEAALGDRQRSMMLSVEYQDIDPALRRNKNNLRPAIAARTTSGSGRTDDEV